MLKKVKFLVDDEEMEFVGEDFLDKLYERTLYYNDGLVCNFFSSRLKKFNFYQLGKTTSEFGSTIMKGKKWMIINDKFIFIVSEEHHHYVYQVDLLINGEIELEKNFGDIYDFLILNLLFLGENNLKDREKFEYNVINENIIRDFIYKISFVYRFNLEFFETIAKYKYENVIFNKKSFLVIFEQTKAGLYNSRDFVIDKIIFLDGFFILVYNNIYFFLDYLEDFDEFLYSSESFVSFLVPYILYKNGIYLNAAPW